MNDKIASLASLYIRPSNKIVLNFIKEKTSKEGHLSSKKMMEENMKQILAMKENKELRAMNMLQIIWGNY